MRKKNFRLRMIYTGLLLALTLGQTALAEGPIVIKNNAATEADQTMTGAGNTGKTAVGAGETEMTGQIQSSAGETEEPQDGAGKKEEKGQVTTGTGETEEPQDGVGESEEDPYAARLQQAKEAVRHREVGRYGMVPVYPSDIVDGTYGIEVESNSPFFKITEAELVAEGEGMYARITISSLSYQYVYMGTAQEAGTDEENWIDCEEADGRSVFTVPVEALDKEIDCAAFSKKRQRWYDRKLVFDASALPGEALEIELPDYELIERALLAYQADGDASGEGAASAGEGASGSGTAGTGEDISGSGTAGTGEGASGSGTAGSGEDASGSGTAGSGEDISGSGTAGTGEGASGTNTPEAVDIAMEDGEYSIEVNMTGGSGRASISSPTLLIVRDGKAYAKLIWSSTYYDYMIIDGTYYYNLTTDGGNSTFEIPITVMDEAMEVIADTTAMGDPVEIEYTLTFYQESVGSKSQIPQEAAKKVLVIAAVIIVAGGILNYFIKKRRK